MHGEQVVYIVISSLVLLCCYYIQSVNLDPMTLDRRSIHHWYTLCKCVHYTVAPIPCLISLSVPS
jgi:hypothetical protein